MSIGGDGIGRGARACKDDHDRTFPVTLAIILPNMLADT